MKGAPRDAGGPRLYERSMDDLCAPDARRRLRAVRALEALGSKAAAPLLAAALGREPEAEVKAALLGALARFEEPFAAELAESRARGPRAPPCGRRARGARRRRGRRAPRIGSPRALSDESPLVRRRAALLLGFSAGERAEATLAVALGDPDRGVARAAAAALSGRPSARAQAALARGARAPGRLGPPRRRHCARPARRRAVDAEGTVSARRASVAPDRRSGSPRWTARSSAPPCSRSAASPRPRRRRSPDATAARPRAARPRLRPRAGGPRPGRAAPPLATAPRHDRRARAAAAGRSGPRASTAAPVQRRPHRRRRHGRGARRRHHGGPTPPQPRAVRRGEVRTSLRGCTEPDLATVLGAPPAASRRRSPPSPRAARSCSAAPAGSWLEDTRWRTSATPRSASPRSSARPRSRSRPRSAEGRQGRLRAEGPRRVLREKLKRAPGAVPARIQLFLNFKGGTGKTSLSSSYAYRLAERGYRVLHDRPRQPGARDEVPRQGGRDFTRTLHDVLIRKVPLDDVTVRPACRTCRSSRRTSR